jgi:hypothetical protein
MSKPDGNLYGSDARLIGRAAGDSGGMYTAALLLVYFISKPFYLFPSGGPQIADIFIALLFIWSFFSRSKLSKEAADVPAACIYFSVYALFVNAIWALVLSDISMLKAPTFFFFNSIVVFVLFSVHARIEDRVIRAILVGIVASLALQFSLATLFDPSSLATDVGSTRSILFFNNPNQLGYWTLLSASIFCVLSRYLQIGLFFQIMVLAPSFYLIAISLGKAASASFFVLLIVHFVRRPSHFIVAAAFGVIGFLVFSDSGFVENLLNRLLSIGSQQDDSIVGRGYYRIWTNPQYLLFGAGEYGLIRFPGEVHELHSTLGTLVFSYGVIGSLLFSVILFRVLSRAGIYNFLYLVPALVYGITHQGLRFSLLWVLFAVLAITGRQRQADSAVSSGLSSRRGPGEGGADVQGGDKPSFRAPP